jgi:hypothetical protein
VMGLERLLARLVEINAISPELVAEAMEPL